jgi:hypothetical protein
LLPSICTNWANISSHLTGEEARRQLWWWCFSYPSGNKLQGVRCDSHESLSWRGVPSVIKAHINGICVAVWWWVGGRCASPAFSKLNPLICQSYQLGFGSWSLRLQPGERMLSQNIW